MKKLLFIVSLLASTITMNAQNFKAEDFKANKTEQVTKTTMTYEIKGEKFPVYQSKSGALYIIRVSKKTGKEYKMYLPKEVQQAMGRKY